MTTFYILVLFYSCAVPMEKWEGRLYSIEVPSYDSALYSTRVEPTSGNHWTMCKYAEIIHEETSN